MELCGLSPLRQPCKQGWQFVASKLGTQNYNVVIVNVSIRKQGLYSRYCIHQETSNKGS